MTQQAAGRRQALLVGVDTFADEGLRALRSPGTEVAALAAVLSDPDIGGFDAQLLVNQPLSSTLAAIQGFFATAGPADLLLLYIASHGLKDESGQLYFAATDTRRDRLLVTAMSAVTLNTMMDRCLSRRIVIILDAPYSEAFVLGMTTRSEPTVDLMDHLGGRGRVIITSSSAMQYAFEGDDVTEEFGGNSGAPQSSSAFTSALVHGLRSGEADVDGDGYVTVDELYDYVYSTTRLRHPQQTPKRWTLGVEGSIVLARAPAAAGRTPPQPLPPLPSPAANPATTGEGPAEETGAEPGARAGPMPQVLPQPRPALSPHAVSDQPSPVDRLGFGPLVGGLEQLLNDPATSLPLAIAVDAPWGGGKSSAMLQLKNRLAATPADAARRWYVVDFPAWKYENSEKLWAALAKAVYEQPQAQMSRTGRTRFKMRLERVRHDPLDFAVKGIGPLLAALAALLVALLTAAAGPTSGRGVPFVGGAAIVLASITATVARYWGIVGDPFKRAIDRHVSKYRYEKQLGFTSEVDEDIQALSDALLHRGDRALAVFVDDLDRCDSKHVVEVVEAVNQIFNSGQNRQCAFLLGMDSAVVAASIDVAYEDTIRMLRTRRSPLADDFGATFLTKIVQMTVSVAVPGPAALRRYLTAVTGDRRPLQALRAPSEQEVTRYEREIEELLPRNPVDVFAAGQTLIGADASESSQLALNEAVRRAQARRFNADSNDVAKAELEVLGCLEANPRQVKRFDNAYRLQLHVAGSTPGAVLDFNIDQLVALGKWVALRLRWPHLARAVDDDPGLLARLEAYAGDPDARDAQAVAAELAPLVADVRALRVFAEPNAARRMTALPLESFLRVT
ncbi:caspase, EACC1-associated type [Actinacidiphila paucisporea]|uniref:KAP family P-loop domain-containing protein n=1 Tax=Actinacidiphila paucisporea TaxID=310782 RepID=A0A1M6XR89_9ACTN|nr:P-loop NTPase fold protein [Actinacidiphila paucisporea]SHL08492.1 KAP family P-loop domain-containing protein [Actinacidiphila paucisporea]